MVRARRRIAIWLAWFVVLNVVWLALVATLNWQEEIAGVVSAAIGATAAEAVQAQGLIQARLKLRWLAGLWMVPWEVVQETWLVFAILARALVRRERVRGRFVCEMFPHTGEDPADEVRRALYKIEASIAPNTYVVGYDDDTGAMLLHQLVE